MKKNEGLTLIELVVVIAIMSVLVGLVGLSVSVLSRQKVSNAASDVKGLLQTAQTIAMSKKSCYVEIKSDSDGVTFTTYTYTKDDRSDKKFMDKVTIGDQISVSVKQAGASSFTSVGSSVIEIKYKRENGAFTDDTIQEIMFSKGTKDVTLRLTKLTGKVSY